MYCKSCGYREDGSAERCPKCSAVLVSQFTAGERSRRSFRWQVPAAALLIGVIAFVVFPRVFMRSELETIGPTNKVRFLRALGNSEYRRVGQKEFRVEGQTLTMIWDLRWTVLPETKQLEIAGIVGRAWKTAGGEETRFRVEGSDETVATYSNGEVHIAAP